MEHKLILVIPVFNEEAHVQSVFNAVRDHYSGDVLFVNDGSSDKSLEIIKELKSVFYITHKANEGYGKSLLDGFAYAKKHDYTRIITMDCDFQHEPSYIDAFVAEMQNHDIVSGSRYLDEKLNIHEAPNDRANINKKITKQINKTTNYHLTDAFCGFKAYRTEAVCKLKLSETGYGFPLQLWLEAAKNKLTVKEIAVPKLYFHIERSFGKLLDNPNARLDYYKQVIEKELQSAS